LHRYALARLTLIWAPFLAIQLSAVLSAFAFFTESLQFDAKLAGSQWQWQWQWQCAHVEWLELGRFDWMVTPKMQTQNATNSFI
jgi:hypothetical protein